MKINLKKILTTALMAAALAPISATAASAAANITSVPIGQSEY